MNERIQRLEEKMAYLERHVVEQDKAMLEMAENLAALRREWQAQRDRASAAGGAVEGGPAPDPANDRPPHY